MPTARLTRLTATTLCAFAIAGCGQPSPEELVIREQATKFLAAIAEKDWRGACDLTTGKEEAERIFASCRGAVSLMASDPPADGWEIRDVSVDGNEATVALGPPTLGPLTMEKVAGEWLVVPVTTR